MTTTTAAAHGFYVTHYGPTLEVRAGFAGPSAWVSVQHGRAHAEAELFRAFPSISLAAIDAVLRTPGHGPNTYHGD